MDDRSTRRAGRGVGAMIVLTLVAASCTADPVGTSEAGYNPTFAPAECPGRVMASATRETSCGYLTVPEDRSEPSGRQIRLFVVRLEPNKPTSATPVVYAGGDLGSASDYFGLSGMADHLDGPEVIGLEPRGVGFSEPNLSCPEVDAISPETLTTPITDQALRRSFAAAVKACYDRFAGQEIDLSAYNMEEAGADLLDLVRVLGLEEWDVITKGSTSRIVFAALRSDPTGMRSVVAYNPEFPDTDWFAQAIEGTLSAVSELETLCEGDDGCARRFPDLTATFNEAIRRFDAHPRMVRIDGRNVLVDGARLLRGFRTLLASIAADEPMYLRLPATIDALAHAKDPRSSITAVVSPELQAPAFCTGYLPACGQTSQGAYYSALCSDIAPFADLSALASLARQGEAWTEDYVDGPYRDICDAWNVRPAGDDSVTAPIESNVPWLVFSSGLDPTVSTAAVRKGVAELPNAFLIVIPVWSHAPSTIPACPYAQPRNEFLADPTSAPNARCQERFQPTFATSPL